MASSSTASTSKAAPDENGTRQSSLDRIKTRKQKVDTHLSTLSLYCSPEIIQLFILRTFDANAIS